MNTTVPAGASSALLNLLPILLFVVFLYLLIILPQKRRQKKHNLFIQALKEGDRVILSGGMIGSVSSIGDKTVELEISNGVNVTVLKQTIISLASEI
ncbi:MAG: preprotein translocase subunit YajC [Leptospirales bacterium]